jgi:hypothetical protein
VVSRDGIRSVTERIDAIRAVPFPRNVQELRRFLGMTNFMRDYIKGYSMLAKPLSQQVNNPVGEWPQREMRLAFETLKDSVTSQLSLAHLDYSVPIVVQFGASILGIAGALINRYPQGDRVIKCVSHAFTEAESKWKTIEQESFAIVFILCFFRLVLIGHYFIVETDHRNIILRDVSEGGSLVPDAPAVFVWRGLYSWGNECGGGYTEQSSGWGSAYCRGHSSCGFRCSSRPDAGREAAGSRESVFRTAVKVQRGSQRDCGTFWGACDAEDPAEPGTHLVQDVSRRHGLDRLLPPVPEVAFGW